MSDDEDLNGANSKKIKLTEDNKEKETENDSDELSTSTDESLNSTSKNSDSEDISIEEAENPNLTPSERIIKCFLVDMPQDFYSFWEFCQCIKPSTLKTYLNLILVGPFDVLSGKMKTNLKSDVYLRHWRFFYDPPEFTTVLVTTEKNSQLHFGYFRDDPNEMPNFVASNNANNDCVLTPLGPNLFAAINAHIKSQIKDFKSKYTKTHLEELKGLNNKLKKWAEDHQFTLDMKTSAMNARQKLVVAKTFHRAGIVVPFDKKTEVGYRPLPETDGKLKKLMQAVVDSETEAEKTINLDKLNEIVTLIQFATDECDYGMGFEFGIDLFCFGDSIFHSIILRLLTLAYDLLQRPQYFQIIKAHLEDRKKNGNMSRLTS
uniref:Histone PARylation factor 1 n=1 Tax=Strigamia maritima TaxID=126957 RepID=T1IPC9_STRMM